MTAHREPEAAAPGTPPAARIIGIDALRGLAVLGMFAAHVGDYGVRDRDGDGWEWLWIVDGRSSAAFALLAGVTIALMFGGRAEHTAPAPFPRVAVKVATRALILIAVGYGLEELDVPIYIVLMSLGTMMLLSIPLVRLPLFGLALATVGFAVAGPFAVRWITPRLEGTPLETAPALETLWGSAYTGLVWMAYLCVGMLVGRLELRDDATLGRVARWGVALAVAGYIVAPAFGGTGTLPGAPRGSVWWLSAAPHGRAGDEIYAPAEVIGNIGIILTVLAALVWLGRRAPRLLTPVAAVGALAFTAYASQVVVLWALDRADGGTGAHAAIYEPSNVRLIAFVGVTLALAWAWRTWMGAGPLERAMTAVSNAAADVATGRSDPVARRDGAPT